MTQFMQNMRKVVTVGVVGGNLIKISVQFGKSVIDDYDYVFSENGLVAHKDGKLIGTQNLKSFLGEEDLKEFINFTLHYITDLDIPIKSQEERDEFERYDKVYMVLPVLPIQNIRAKMVSVLREKFAHLNLTFSIGGQISFDVFPQGWVKTYCLKYLDNFHEIHFFGDKTYKQGGNDHEIYESERTVGHTGVGLLVLSWLLPVVLRQIVVLVILDWRMVRGDRGRGRGRTVGRGRRSLRSGAPVDEPALGACFDRSGCSSYSCGSRAAWDACISEFYMLEQGDMSIVGYDQRFNELSRYVPFIVQDEEQRRIKFLKGLCPYYRNFLIASGDSLYKEVLSKVLAIEQNDVEDRKSKDLRNQMRQDQRADKGKAVQGHYESSGPKRQKLGSTKGAPARFIGGQHLDGPKFKDLRNQMRQDQRADMGKAVQGHYESSGPKRQKLGSTDGVPTRFIGGQHLDGTQLLVFVGTAGRRGMLRRIVLNQTGVLSHCGKFMVLLVTSRDRTRSISFSRGSFKVLRVDR
ncbi:hypothetical protein GIB67_009207 [Kingdonia uniflora]|uniref:Phosphomannomutase n=1 Tax=Kingdonia uniflora TaxID=39325 RepID=A0A7J7N2R4_9MAGN|nr:hypothetical protein GIB67_009207 [Kingdonia uniflora]